MDVGTAYRSLVTRRVSSTARRDRLYKQHFVIHEPLHRTLKNTSHFMERARVYVSYRFSDFMCFHFTSERTQEICNEFSVV